MAPDTREGTKGGSAAGSAIRTVKRARLLWGCLGCGGCSGCLSFGGTLLLVLLVTVGVVEATGQLYYLCQALRVGALAAKTNWWTFLGGLGLEGICSALGY